MGKNTVKTEYMYSTPRFRFAEGKMLSLSKMYELAFSDDEASVLNALEENGNVFFADTAYVNVGDEVLNNAFKLLSDISENEDVYSFLRYPYDCHNIKCAIKCSIRKQDASSLMYTCGAKNYMCAVDGVENGDFSVYPENMAKAALSAIEIYAKTKNPAFIDMTLDKACFADMLKDAEKTGSSYLVSLVKTKIDLINIITFVRVCRTTSEILREDVFNNAYICGGALDMDIYKQCLSLGVKEFKEKLSSTKYDSIICDVNSPLWVMEKAADEAYLKLVYESRYISFGVEVGAGYIAAKEMEAKNIRILINGLHSHIGGERIKERLRCMI